MIVDTTIIFQGFFNRAILTVMKDHSERATLHFYLVCWKVLEVSQISEEYLNAAIVSHHIRIFVSDMSASFV